jgi:hypothetical protein
MVTWLLWPAEAQETPPDCAHLVRHLRKSGVTLTAMPDGALGVQAPSTWWNPDREMRLRERTVALVAWLTGGADA